MPTLAPDQIESEFARLTTEAQLSLLERLVHRVRLAVSGRDEAWDAELSAMASDPDIQRELGCIDGEFRSSEADGLGRD